MIAAPVVWTGLELVRAHFATGFLMAALAHTQYRWISLIQICDLVGSYGVSFLVMFVAACLTTALPLGEAPLRRWPLAAAGLAIAAALAYGHWRANDQPGREGPKIALIQGSIDTEFGVDPIKQRKTLYRQYMDLSYQALRADPETELLVWPESMYVMPFLLIDDGAYLPAEEAEKWPKVTTEEARQLEANQELPEAVVKLHDAGRDWFRRTTADLSLFASVADGKRPAVDGGPSLLIGVECEHYRPGRVDHFNTSIHLDNAGEVKDYYHKMHPVMFGEYVPLGGLFPSLYKLTPMSSGLTAGRQAKSYDVSGTLVAPNICYETVLPHVIRRQVRMLSESGGEPDVLLTQTNDGWFWGSPALDMHLICGVFRAVECRKPLLIAANTGFSASIDGDGRVLVRGPRRETDFLLVRPRIDPRHSFYVDTGDWFAWLCAASCAGLALVGLVRWWNSLRRRAR
jgi:apolipoprotein N-acyltransferase